VNISEYMGMVITAWLGIDIAKQKFDVALSWNTRRRAKVFRKDAEGCQALLRWLTDLGVGPVHACLEATGRYGEGLALHLPEAGHRVSVVNPSRSSTSAASSWAATPGRCRPDLRRLPPV
jgi:transposase